MSEKVSLTIDGPVLKYIEIKRPRYNGSRAAVVREWIQRGYDADMEALYRQYQRGEITLRNMAAELGLAYRELYALLEEKGWPF